MTPASRTTRFAALALGFAAVACSDSTAPASRARQVSVSFSTTAGTSTAGVQAQAAAGILPSIGAGALSAAIVATSTDTLVIDKAQLVLFKAELLRDSTSVGADSSADSSATCGEHETENESEHQGRGRGQGGGHGSDDCDDDEVKFGPILVDLPIDDAVVTALDLPIPQGTYRFMEAKFRPARSDKANGAAFLAQHPDLAGVSVRVEGTFNGQPFTFLGSEDAEIELRFSPPLVVDGSGAGITVNVDLASWFRDSSGRLFDPRTANAGGANEERVARNIKRSFKVSED